MIEVDQGNVDELIACFLSNGATPEEQNALLRWIEANSSNRAYYMQAYQAWAGSAQMQQSDVEREAIALRKIHRRISSLVMEDDKKRTADNTVYPSLRGTKQSSLSYNQYVTKYVIGKEPKTVILRHVFRYAAAIAVLLVVSTYIIMYHSMSPKATVLAGESTYEAFYGTKAFAALPDGSKVWLNVGSKLSVQAGYNSNDRRVNLSGEAYFEVVSNAGKPFIVQAGNLSVKATGTTFNVKAYPDEKQISATLVEGVIYVEGRDEREKEFSVKVSPGQTFNYTTPKMMPEENTQKEAVVSERRETLPQMSASPPMTIKRMNTEAITSWRKNSWIIDNEEFGQLAVLLERRYNVEIRFTSEKLKQYRFSGTIERETIEEIFDLLRYSIPLKYTIEKGVINLKVDKVLEKQYEKAWKQK